MNIDPTTGLPELPENMRWEVKEFDTDFPLEVCLQRKMGFLWFDVCSRLARHGTSQSILDAAIRTLEAWQGRNQRRVERDRAVEKFAGTYPPKSLTSGEDHDE